MTLRLVGMMLFSMNVMAVEEHEASEGTAYVWNEYDYYMEARS